MEKILINLLPHEFTIAQVQQSKFRKIQIIGWGVVLILLLLSAGSFGYRIIQLQDLVKTETDLTAATQIVKGLQKKEVAINVLKSRVSSINDLTNIPSKQRVLYNLVEKLVPSQVTINTLTVDRSGNLVMAITLPDSETLEALTTSLLNKEKNEDKISQIVIDGLNRTREGNYRTNLTIKAK